MINQFLQSAAYRNRSSYLTTKRLRLSDLAAVLLITGLSACFVKPHLTAEQQINKINEFTADGGYVSTQQQTIRSTREIWLHDKVLLDTTLVIPDKPGSYPVVLYLPGLGEDANAGSVWRQNWAKAGYAVFTLQPITVGIALKGLDVLPKPSGTDSVADNNELTRLQTLQINDLHYLGREYFSEAELTKRVSHVAYALSELTRRAKQKSSLFALLDLSKIVLAGYDLGAQTVAALTGQTDGQPKLAEFDTFKPIAAMVFSPSVDLAAGNVSERYRDLKLPLLVVTGPVDVDPYGISIPEIRAAIWQYAPVGGKYLLLVEESGHEVFSGSSLQPQKYGMPEIGMGSPGGGPPGFSRFSDKLYSVNRFGGGGDMGGGPPPGAMGGHPGRGEARVAVDSYKQVAIIRSVSTAFLDATVKSDTVAQQWLVSDDFALWAGRLAVLQHK
ncbi:MAG: hypothetical protein Q7U57_03925 [Methylovulum sp.]|nr:hypothetical protein [Methylovulum sp.]